MSGVHTRMGEFDEDEAADRAMSVLDASCAEFVRIGREQERNGWLAFAVNVEHATAITGKLKDMGVSADLVTGATPKGERQHIISRYKARMTTCLVSVGVLTTGFNAPHVDLVGLMRPTKSAGLYVQMVGRAFRLAPGKKNALILDYGGNVERHGPVDKVKPRRRRKKGDPVLPEEKEERAKRCPSCRTLNEVRAIECIECGFEWPKPAPDLTPTADERPILSIHAPQPEEKPKQPPQWFSVDRISMYLERRRFASADKPKSVLIEMHAEDETFQLRLPYSSDKPGAQKIITKNWRSMGGKLPIPETYQEAWDRKEELRFAHQILVDIESKYKNILVMRLDDGRPAYEEQPDTDDFYIEGDIAGGFRAF